MEKINTIQANTININAEISKIAINGLSLILCESDWADVSVSPVWCAKYIITIISITNCTAIIVVMSRDKKQIAKTSLIILIGFLVGVIWLVSLRVVLAKNTSPHYHANFAVFVNGERLKFEGPTFYEEITACSDDQSSDPKTRAHMHSNVSYLVHVHDDLVTWGNFFANLRYGVSDKALTLDDVVLVDGQNNNQLSFVLNGQQIDSVANKVINSEDRLLISYGQADSSQLNDQFNQVEQDAKDYNQKQDPASCSGSEALSWSQKFKKAISFN